MQVILQWLAVGGRPHTPSKRGIKTREEYSPGSCSCYYIFQSILQSSLAAHEEVEKLYSFASFSLLLLMLFGSASSASAIHLSPEGEGQSWPG